MEVTSLKGFFMKNTLEEVNQQLKNLNYLISLIGVEVKEIKEGKVIIEFPYKEELTRRGGILHGGIIMTSMDLAGGLAVGSMNEGNEQFTQELKVNFLEPMQKGPFKVEAKVVRKGRNSVVVLIEFKDAEERIGAIGIGTWYIFKERK